MHVNVHLNISSSLLTASSFSLSSLRLSKISQLVGSAAICAELLEEPGGRRGKGQSLFSLRAHFFLLHRHPQTHTYLHSYSAISTATTCNLRWFKVFFEQRNSLTDVESECLLACERRAAEVRAGIGNA
jgi:hypothetical protein